MRSLKTVALLFVAAAVPSGLLVALLTGLALQSPTTGIALGTGAGLFFGAVMAVVLGGMDAFSDRAPQDAPRGPRQTITVPVRGGPDLHHRIVAALLGARAEIREADAAAGRYLARTTMTCKSFGEDIAVQLTGDPGAPEAVVSSRPVVRTTLVDYGKGRSNVAAVADALRQ